MPPVKPKKLNVGRPKDDQKAYAILEAAGTLFLKNGMMGTTMDEIAQAAGVSKLTVYNHFGNTRILSHIRN